MFARERAEPFDRVGSRLELECEPAALGKIDGVGMTGIGEAVIAVVDEFVVRIGLPPVKACHEVDDVAVAEEHGHGIVATTVDPAPASIWPNIGAATRGLAGSLVSASHDDVPGNAAKRIRRFLSWKSPERVVVFVTILLVGLRNDAARLPLEFAGLEHEGMLIAGPFLVGGETEPGGSTILVTDLPSTTTSTG